MIYVKTAKRGTGQFSMDVPVVAAASREGLATLWDNWLCGSRSMSNEWARDKRGQLVTATTILTDGQTVTRG